MPLVNIDTDMIIPKQFLKTIKRSGLGVNLFDEMRYTQDGQEIPDFVLNQSPPIATRRSLSRATISAAVRRANTHLGRFWISESVVWFQPALLISSTITASRTAFCPSFLPQEQVDSLMDDARKGENARITVDLAEQTVTGADGARVQLRD